MKKNTLVLVVAFLLCVQAIPVIGAFSRQKTSRISDEKQKILNKTQTKAITHQLVKEMFSNDFFEKLELPEKMVMAKLQVVGDGVGSSDRQFTDFVLNEILQSSQALILNQDLKIDLSMNFQLMNYLNADEARRQGVFMGADYYLDGRIESVPEQSERGKIKYNYVARLSLFDIRSNKEILTVHYDHNEKNRSKRKPR